MPKVLLSASGALMDAVPDDIVPACAKWIEVKHNKAKANLPEVSQGCELVEVSITKGDYIVWFSNGGQFTVDFDKGKGSPFKAGKTFTVPAKGIKSSGFPTPNIPLGKYGYHVIDAQGNRSADPDVIIRP